MHANRRFEFMTQNKYFQKYVAQITYLQQLRVAHDASLHSALPQQTQRTTHIPVLSTSGWTSGSAGGGKRVQHVLNNWHNLGPEAGGDGVKLLVRQVSDLVVLVLAQPVHQHTQRS